MPTGDSIGGEGSGKFQVVLLIVSLERLWTAPKSVLWRCFVPKRERMSLFLWWIGGHAGRGDSLQRSGWAGRGGSLGGLSAWGTAPRLDLLRSLPAFSHGVIKSGHVAPALTPKNHVKDCQGQSRFKICLKFVMIQFPFLGTLCLCIFYVSEGGLGIR